MALTRSQFHVLEALATAKEALSQRIIGEKTGFALGKVNKVIKELSELGFAEKCSITEKGLAALEPYRVKRAVFMAAGFGSRMIPVTLSTPKPLVRVNGKRIIDGLLDACLEAEIEEIYIIRGYLAENFDMLLAKYPMIKFIENPAFNDANNILSLLMAKDLLSDSYVLEADLIIHNPDIIKKYQYSSNFLGIRKERSDDWAFIEKNGYIHAHVHGAANCWQEVGISYWNHEDGKKLAKHLQEAYEMPGGRELFFESVPLLKFANEYKIEIRECFDEDIVEIDSFSELKQIDKTYDV